MTAPLPPAPDRAREPIVPGSQSGSGRTDVRPRPRIGIVKFASCDGCQLTLLDLEDELLAIAERIDIVEFAEATSHRSDGPFDILFVEGSISTPEQAADIVRLRAATTTLVTIGACATSGGIQALRNFADVREWIPLVYASPEFVSTLDTSTPIADHVQVDLELRGCPISKAQLVETVSALLHRRRPHVPTTSVCMECKARGTPCVMVAHGTPCLGPVTQAGCGAICPSYARGCYGCFGPMESPNITALARQWQSLGVGDDGMLRALRTFNANAPAFREASYEHE
jgi:coenzyme F420-reducing hydrogenase gamma subunit